MARTRYSLVQRSGVTADDGTFYPDLMTLPIQRFRFTSPPTEYYLTQRDIERPDLLMYRIYRVAEFDDIIFWLNGIAYIGDATVGTKILLPSREDLEDFFLENRV